jgi:hypothetical protein
MGRSRLIVILDQDLPDRKDVVSFLYSDPLESLLERHQSSTPRARVVIVGSG